MFVIPFLICFPFLAAFILMFAKNAALRDLISYIGAVVIMAMAGVLLYAWLTGGSKPMGFYRETEIVDHIMRWAEFLIMGLIIVLSFKYKRRWVSLLSIVSTIIIVCTEYSMPKESIDHIFVDRMSMLMCAIIALIGGLIIIYAVGYMSGYHQHHKEVQNRSHYFFALLFVFMGAMFGFVLSASLIWLYFFWECTSVCSFLLIGYTRTDEAVANSFRALWMNLLGGLALAVGIFYFAFYKHTLSFREFIALGTAKDFYTVLPVALMAFAALTKAAQLPFSTWLLGAMVAPTPSSALLHSATMVKAGIYVLLRLAPAMNGTTTGMMISLIGGFTFFLASFMAIAQSDAKKVLAMSTVSNLGLMVACAGTGTTETVWAGVFLMIFHAVSKSLLFLDVGATENAMHSRDIEDMHGMIFFLPKLALFMFIGIAGMFLAPFGMLISKWAALRAAIDESNIVLLIFIVFGSATTSFYWSKWMGKIISHPHMRAECTDITRKNEMISMTAQAFMMVALCILFPVLSQIYVDPMLEEMFGTRGEVLSQGLLYMLTVIICFIFVVPPLFLLYSRKMHANRKLSYMGGINIGDNCSFVDSFGEQKRLWLSNYYFAGKIGIRKLMLPCQILTAAILIAMFCMILGAAL